MKEGNAEMINLAGESYGDLIRRHRRSKKLSQEELGALVHVKKNAVGAWEAGRSRPDLAGVPVLCEALGITVDQFFGLSGPEREEPALREKYGRLNADNRQEVLRQMDMLYQLQEEESEDDSALEQA